jgi:hypothetical protein
MRALGLVLLGLVATAAAAQRPRKPGPPSIPTDTGWERFGEEMGKFGEQMGRMGESLGNRFGSAFGDTAFTNATRSDPEILQDPKVKAAMKRFIRLTVNHSPDAAQAEADFHRALADARRQRMGSLPASPGAPMAPLPPMPPTPPTPPTAPGGALTGAARKLIDLARLDPTSLPLPALSAFSAGPRVVDPGSDVSGTVATVQGPLTIGGTVEGDAVAVGGDVIVQSGAHVKGNAFAAKGEVHVEPGGRVDGEIRSLPLAIGPTSVRVEAPKQRSTWRSLELAIAWFGLALVLGIGVLTFASDRLDAAAAALSDQFGRSVGVGFVGLIAVLPVAVIGVVVLCATIVGILALPVWLLGVPLLAIGISVLGLSAVAETVGHAIYRGDRGALSDRGAKLRALVTGIALLMGLWVLAAAGTWVPVAGVLLRGVAISVTAVALMAGFGSVLLAHRARRVATGPMSPAIDATDAMWQTPTPVGGVAAARRPTPAPPKQPVP